MATAEQAGSRSTPIPGVPPPLHRTSAKCNFEAEGVVPRNYFMDTWPHETYGIPAYTSADFLKMSWERRGNISLENHQYDFFCRSLGWAGTV